MAPSAPGVTSIHSTASAKCQPSQAAQRVPPPSLEPGQLLRPGRSTVASATQAQAARVQGVCPCLLTMQGCTLKVAERRPSPLAASWSTEAEAGWALASRIKGCALSPEHNKVAEQQFQATCREAPARAKPCLSCSLCRGTRKPMGWLPLHRMALARQHTKTGSGSTRGRAICVDMRPQHALGTKACFTAVYQPTVAEHMNVMARQPTHLVHNSRSARSADTGERPLHVCPRE